MFYMSRLLLITIALAFLLMDTVSAQEEPFIKQMEALGLYFYSTLESAYKYFGRGSNEIFSYEMRMKNKTEGLEIFLIYNRTVSGDKLLVPHIEFTRQIADMATNDEDARIWTKNFSVDDLKKYHADWGAEAEFYLKKGISRFRKGRVVCIFREGRQMASVLYCYNKKSQLPDLISFIDDASQQ